MKNICKGAVIGALFVFLTGCASGMVENKRAAGPSGHKTYQLRIDDKNPLAPEELWITVTREQWEACQMEERYPDCRR
jgi:hypothetical protein